jgi:hypothetical protein
MDKDDPPIFVSNYHQNGIPANEDELNHHPLHAKAIKEKAEEVGLEGVVYAPALELLKILRVRIWLASFWKISFRKDKAPWK